MYAFLHSTIWSIYKHVNERTDRWIDGRKTHTLESALKKPNLVQTHDLILTFELSHLLSSHIIIGNPIVDNHVTFFP